MRRLRRALVHTFVWLTAATTLVAGTPQVQCGCAVAAMPAQNATVGEEPCCCCVPKPAVDTVSRSCCHSMSASKDDFAGPTIRSNECQKIVVQPADAAVQRTSAECQHSAVIAGFTATNFSTATVVQVGAVNVDLPPLPPPIDVHLVLQHFVI